MIQISSMLVIHAPADAIWQVISDFGTACKYLFMVVNCKVVGVGVSTQRTLTCADGSAIVERPGCAG